VEYRDNDYATSVRMNLAMMGQRGSTVIGYRGNELEHDRLETSRLFLICILHFSYYVPAAEKSSMIKSLQICQAVLMTGHSSVSERVSVNSD
jgi:hypothetical protein